MSLNIRVKSMLRFGAGDSRAFLKDTNEACGRFPLAAWQA